MTWPVRSKLLGTYLGTPAINTLITLGTVPAGKTWLLKEVSVFNNGPAVRQVFFWANPGGGAIVIAAFPAVAAGTGLVDHDRHLVLPAGGLLQFSSSTNGSLHLYVSGAQLG